MPKMLYENPYIHLLELPNLTLWHIVSYSDLNFKVLTDTIEAPSAPIHKLTSISYSIE